ncbi:peroxiredoxin family protein [Ferruginibacter profundus]
MQNKVAILLSLSFLISFSSCNTKPDKTPEQDLLQKYRTDSAINARKEKGLKSLTKNIGEKFSIENFIDTSGKPVQLDFTKSDITIIDFWFDGCTACINEMNQFKDILKNKEHKVRIISTCISSYEAWKSLFIRKNDIYSFLTIPVTNWLQLNLKSNDDPKLHNSLSNDRKIELEGKLDVSFFPAYFVINKEGIIIARPMSAVEYIKNNIK